MRAGRRPFTTSWGRCFGLGRLLRLVLGRDRRGGPLTGSGAARRPPGRVGSEGEAGYRAQRRERGRGEQDLVESAGGARAGGVRDSGAGGGRDGGGYPGSAAGGNSGDQPVDGVGWRGQARQGVQGGGGDAGG